MECIAFIISFIFCQLYPTLCEHLHWGKTLLINHLFACVRPKTRISVLLSSVYPILVKGTVSLLMNIYDA